jgi:hypothetical protein
MAKGIPEEVVPVRTQVAAKRENGKDVSHSPHEPHELGVMKFSEVSSASVVSGNFTTFEEASFNSNFQNFEVSCFFRGNRFKNFFRLMQNSLPFPTRRRRCVQKPIHKQAK